MADIRGLTKEQEQRPSQLLRDTRTIGQRIADFFSNPVYVSSVLVALAVTCWLYPMVADLILFSGVLMFLFCFTRKSTLPFRMPMASGQKDYNDMMPGTANKPYKARGIYFFANEIQSNGECWFNNDDMRTHVLIFGSTGSGKTEALVSIAYNALMQGSGFIYVDGKGDNSLYAKVFSLARSMGREDDVLVVNFMTGARDIIGPQLSRLSNTLNPFSMGSSSMLSQLVVSMMDSSGSSPDGDMWKGRAIAFVEALMKVLVAMRDLDAILLDAHTIRNYFNLPKLEDMVLERKFWREGQEPYNLENIPPVVLEPIKNYLDNLPGYDPSKKGKQSSQVLEQHGFITMQLTRAFTSLADTYSHIMRHNLAEVDFKDVVLNRRILVVLLPALEKSPEELSNLGKVIVASLKAMMAAGLGDQVEGTYTEVIERKPTNSPTPYLCILDEYGYYAVPGFAVVPAQARSLGFSVVFAGQDLPAFQKASKEEAASIGANTNIKICMKLEDPTDTWDFFMKTAGESYVTKVDHFQTDAQSFTHSYLDTKSASAEKRARIDLLDLKEQSPGEAHIFFQSTIIRARMFYAAPPASQKMRLNQMLKVEAPTTRELLDLEAKMRRFKEGIDNLDDPIIAPVDDAEDITLVANSLGENPEISSIERGVQALLAYHNRSMPEEEEVEEVVELPPGEMNIFTDMRITPDLQRLLLTSDVDTFGIALLSRKDAREAVEHFERIVGKSTRHASNVAEEIIKDMTQATFYPPIIQDQISTAELVSVVNDLTMQINRINTENAS